MTDRKEPEPARPSLPVDYRSPQSPDQPRPPSPSLDFAKFIGGIVGGGLITVLYVAFVIHVNSPWAAHIAFFALIGKIALGVLIVGGGIAYLIYTCGHH